MSQKDMPNPHGVCALGVLLPLRCWRLSLRHELRYLAELVPDLGISNSSESMESPLLVEQGDLNQSFGTSLKTQLDLKPLNHRPLHPALPLGLMLMHTLDLARWSLTLIQAINRPVCCNSACFSSKNIFGGKKILKKQKKNSRLLVPQEFKVSKPL